MGKSTTQTQMEGQFEFYRGLLIIRTEIQIRNFEQGIDRWLNLC